MAGCDVDALKAEQDRLENRKKRLLDISIPFRDGFVEELERFANEATEVGLRGVKPCRRQVTDEVLEVTFTLNHFDLVLIAGDKVVLRDRDSDELASKMFIFEDVGCEDIGPFAMIEIWESGEKSYAYAMRFFSEEEPKSPYVEDTSVSKRQGQQTAATLIEWFYRDTWSFWPRRPRLKIMRTRQVRRGTLGFQRPAR